MFYSLCGILVRIPIGGEKWGEGQEIDRITCLHSSSVRLLLALKGRFECLRRKEKETRTIFSFFFFDLLPSFSSLAFWDVE